MKSNKKHPPYVRIGVNYFKCVPFPTFNGTESELKLITWNKQTIVDDHGRDFLAAIPQYDAMITVPDHITYKQRIGTCYNNYHPLKYLPEPGNIPYTKLYLKHIFGNQYELALDYLAILYLYPTQILPVLCLVSQERNTGKTTFLKWLKLIFGLNFTLNTNEEFRSRFNSDWTSKVGVGVDETFLEKKEDSERLKNLSTANLVKTESKGVDKIETLFFAKFILCSNNETNFIYVDSEEIRYWVIKVPVFTQEILNLLDMLEKEIPSFLYFLQERGVKYPKKSRMWFAPEDIWTPALQKLKEENASTVEKELREIIIDQLITYNLKEVSFTIKDLLEELRKSNIRSVNRHYIGKILKEHWGIKPVENASTYKKYYSSEGVTMHMTCQGRYYTFYRKEFVAPKASTSDKPQQE